jgi:proline dehydrogenase
MPGETLDEALAAAQALQQKNIGSVFTQLGENVRDREEARHVAEHYLAVLERIHQQKLPTEVSVKLTQLGLDLSPDFCFENLEQIIRREKEGSIVWVDMESSNYVDVTLELYRRALKKYPNVGICLQAYLYRTTSLRRLRIREKRTWMKTTSHCLRKCCEPRPRDNAFALHLARIM